MSFAIRTKALVKEYKALKALGGVSLEVARGSFFGLLGPNGAGKTTLIRILTTLIKPTSGAAYVMEHDVVKDPFAVRRAIGVVPQAMTTDLDLTGYEAMDIYARFYGMGKDERKERIKALLDMVGLTERAGSLIATYSGGMRRRLEIARGLVHRPELLILDEPTIGLDPQSRHVVWDILKRFREESNLTILLTTHYMDEAEAMCDKVAIIDYGKIVALDSVEGLKKLLPRKDTIELGVGRGSSGIALEALKDFPGLMSCVVKDDDIVLSVPDGARSVVGILSTLESRGISVSKVLIKAQTLEDVFIHFTGRPIREEEAKKVSFLIGAGAPRGNR